MDSLSAPCFLYQKKEWTIGEWYHREAWYKYHMYHSIYPEDDAVLISVYRPGMEPFSAFFSSDKGRVFFIETDAETTDDIVFITLNPPKL